MAKTIIKEIGIVILLLLAISLLLAVIFYDYIPNNKIVPVKMQAYNIPDDIKEELKNSISGEQNIVNTFYIDSSDLDLYESTNDYDKGKANPFADYSTQTTENTSDSTKTDNNTKNTNTSKNTDTSNSDDEKNNNQDNSNKNEVYINSPGKNY